MLLNNSFPILVIFTYLGMYYFQAFAVVQIFHYNSTFVHWNRWTFNFFPYENDLYYEENVRSNRNLQKHYHPAKWCLKNLSKHCAADSRSGVLLSVYTSYDWYHHLALIQDLISSCTGSLFISQKPVEVPKRLRTTNVLSHFVQSLSAFYEIIYCRVWLSFKVHKMCYALWTWQFSRYWN